MSADRGPAPPPQQITLTPMAGGEWHWTLPGGKGARREHGALKPGDQLTVADRDTGTSVVCLIAEGDLSEPCATDRLLLAQLQRRVETLQRLVDQERARRGGLG